MRVPNPAPRIASGVLFASLILSLFIASCEAPKGPGTGAPAGGGAKLQIVGGDTINWGRVAPDALKHDIKIVNVGGDTLKITDVRPGCGCTTAPIDKKELLPGDTATVKVTLDATNRSGELHKSITIASNDSARRSFQVSLLAFVVREIVATPEFFPIVDSAKTGVEDTTSIELKNTGDMPVTIEPPTFGAAPEMILRFDMNAPVTLQPGAVLRVLAHVKPIKVGTSTADVIFKTSAKNGAQVKVPLTVVVRES